MKETKHIKECVDEDSFCEGELKVWDAGIENGAKVVLYMCKKHKEDHQFLFDAEIL